MNENRRFSPVPNCDVIHELAIENNSLLDESQNNLAIVDAALTADLENSDFRRRANEFNAQFKQKTGYDQWLAGVASRILGVCADNHEKEAVNNLGQAKEYTGKLEEIELAMVVHKWEHEAGSNRC